jgi:hypothetical protein
VLITVIAFSGTCAQAASPDDPSPTAQDSVAAKRAGVVSKPQGTESDDKNGVRHIIFGEQKIEAKILRPQLVLIKADQRPDFPPMVNQPLGKTLNIAAQVDPSLIEAPHKGAFQFQGTRIINPAP